MTHETDREKSWKDSTLVWSYDREKFVSYRELSLEEKRRFDEQYPYDGMTYEEYCGAHS